MRTRTSLALSSHFAAAAAAAAVAVAVATLAGCASSNSSSDASGEEQDLVSDAATLTLTADRKTNLVGAPAVGKGLVVDYAIDRLPQCRGSVNGGGPNWTITGFYSENGAPAKSFNVTKLTADGRDRVAAPGRIVPSTQGDLAIWFQASSGLGCSMHDSAFGQNYHLSVEGPVPSAAATITFPASGAPVQTGVLEAGGKVKIHYEQGRLPTCRRTQGGSPAWAISGFSQIDGEAKHAFDTGVAAGSDRQAVDALVDLPHAGKLSLWFQVVDIGGCNQYDSNSSANYSFGITE